MNQYAVSPAARTVTLQRLLPGPVERLWAWLTESDKRAKWLATGDMDLRPGGKVTLTFRNSELTTEPAPEQFRQYEGTQKHCTISKAEPNRLLSFSWGDDEDPSEVTFELKPQGDKVLLTVTHQRLEDRDTMVSVSSGWHAHLGVLEDLLEGRELRPFWTVLKGLREDYEKSLPAEEETAAV